MFRRRPAHAPLIRQLFGRALRRKPVFTLFSVAAMLRLLFFCLLLVSTGLGPEARAQSAADLPARPEPFQFVTDQGQLLNPADAKTLEGGLRRYADNTGTQIVVVTVPALAGRSAAEYGRALGAAWGIGQRGQDNGVVILVAKQERTVTIQAGAGLRRQLTPAVTDQVIREDMTPRFKQGNYFAGLKAGLNTLMLAANPTSDPRKNQSQTATAPTESPATAPYATPNEELTTGSAAAPDPVAPVAPAPEPASSGLGLGIGALAVAVVVIGGGLWLIVRFFRRRATAVPPASGGAAPHRAPDFLPNQPSQPNQSTGNYGRGGYGNQPGPDFLPGRGPATGSTGGGMGGVLLTGAAAAAGAYLGNRMANGSDDQAATPHLTPDTTPPHSLDTAGAAGTGVAGGFPFLGNSGTTADEAGPDYFTEDPNGTDGGSDYFSADDSPSSYDAPSSDDTGGSGFDDTNDNTGTW